MTKPFLNSRVGARFVLESVAGSGGMGTVYRALDEQTGDIVAVKLLHDVAEGEAADRFAREAQVLAELDHPGIVRYVAHGVNDEKAPFLAMEWLEGEDLAKRLSRGPMNFSEAMILVRGAAEALGFAHAHGVVHRDVKPSNVFLRGGSVGDVALLDFGIAHMNSSACPLTATGDFIGTPAYVAPEQARGASVVGSAADVFSLGCILHECITGMPAFGGGNIVAILAKILLSTPPRIRDLRRNVPDSIDMLLSRMLERDPAMRLPNGRAVFEALEAIEPVSLDAYDRTPVISSRRFGVADLERQLICVLIASLSRIEDTTLESAQVVSLFDLADELRKFGACAETMADGSLVATFAPTRGAATDQAAIAARAALLLKTRWPEAIIVLCTGRGQVQGTLPMGDVLDRAAAMLRTHGNVVEYVLVDDVTRRLLGARFRVDESTPGMCVLMGEDATLDPSRPLLGKPTPCVGRESELSLLDLALTDAIDDASPHAVLVIAPPGTGKSRLRHEFIRRAESRESPPLVLLGRGDPMSAGSAYGILGEALKRCAGIAEGEELAVRRQKLMRNAWPNTCRRMWNA
jgi:serine/threonine protein kinase